MQKYVCGVCGYEYDPAEHDNVPFDQLPDDWTCPCVRREQGSVRSRRIG